MTAADRPLRLLLTLALSAACSSDEDDAPQQGEDTGEDRVATDGGGSDEDSGDESGGEVLPTYDYDVPLDPTSPWPKFRRNARQTGASPALPEDGAGEPWVFETTKGIFSSPVIGGDGTVYIGSADRNFYAIDDTGQERWHFATGEIIDSSALLDDEGRVIFGSGDGHLYALDAQTGEELWTFAADDPSDQAAFINWFEGNVAMGPDGSLVVPNDNFLIYNIDRRSGEERWAFEVGDQTWSLPAVDPATGNLYIGNNSLLALLGPNHFSIGPDGEERWNWATNGSIAASPLLTEDGLMIVGGFDGFLRALDTQTGEVRWDFGVRDHIYASPAQLPDGLIVQPAADGTVYALDPETGAQEWAFDIREPIRSSPAVDGEGNVYFGAGDGKLYVLRADGTLRFSMQLIESDRNDLNGSPALGPHSVHIAGESGQIFSVPFDWCLGDGTDDERCDSATGEALEDEGARLYFTEHYGGILPGDNFEIAPNEALAFSLFVREDEDTALAHIDSESVTVDLTPKVEAEVLVSGDRRFLTVVPQGAFEGDELSVRIRGEYLVDPERDGLSFSGGARGGDFDDTFTFDLRSDGPGAMPLPVPSKPGDPSGVWELYRLAAPMPTILPSYNQIGFDSLHFLVGLVEGDQEHAIAWVAGAWPDEETGELKVDPDTGALFPLEVSYDDGALTLVNEDGMTLEVMAAVLSFEQFRVAGEVDDEGGIAEGATVTVSTVCEGIEVYGTFLRILGFCNPQTDVLNVYGAALMRPHEGGVQQVAPADPGEVSFGFDDDGAWATLEGASVSAKEHAVGLLLIDDKTGEAIALPYGTTTQRESSGGAVTRVSVPFPEGTELPGALRMWLMVDTYPAATGTVFAED